MNDRLNRLITPGLHYMFRMLFDGVLFGRDDDGIVCLQKVFSCSFLRFCIYSVSSS